MGEHSIYSSSQKECEWRCGDAQTNPFKRGWGGGKGCKSISRGGGEGCFSLRVRDAAALRVLWIDGN